MTNALSHCARTAERGSSRSPRSWWPNLLALLLIVAALLAPKPAEAALLELEWQAPTTNTDGSPLTDLSHYRVYFGTGSGTCRGLFFVDVPAASPTPSPGLVTYSLTGLLSATTYWVTVSAMDLSGAESACSNEASGPAKDGLAVVPNGSVNFGSVRVGDSVEQTFTVTNNTPATLAVTASVSAPYSVISPGTSFNVGVGGSTAVVVRYSPTTTGTHTRTLTFGSSAGNVTRSLSGTGTDESSGVTQTAPSGPITTLRPTYSWTAGTGATSYEVWVSTSTSGVPTITRTTTSATSLTSPVALAAGKLHYWWVKANNGAWVGPMSFTPNATTVTQTGPAGNITTLTPTYAWTAANGTTSYEVWVSTSTSGVPTILRTTTGATSLPSPEPLSPGSTYYWWVKPDNGAWAGPMSFTPNVGVSQTGPLGSVTTLTPTYAWTVGTGTTSYEVWVSTSTSGVPTTMRETTTTTSLTSPVTLSPGSTYYWWVKPNNGTWVGPMSFLATGAVVTQTGPSGSITSLTPTYAWTAGAGTSGYEVWVSTSTSGVPTIMRQTTTGTSLTSPVTLSPGSTYYWWVKPNNGLWTGPRSFTATGAVVSQTGPSGSIGTLTPTYRWTAGAGTSSYEVWVSTSTSGVPTITRQTTTATSLTSPVTLSPGSTYYWWVKPDNGMWAGPVSFTPR